MATVCVAVCVFKVARFGVKVGVTAGERERRHCLSLRCCCQSAKDSCLCLVLPQLGCAGHSPRCDCRSRRFVVAGARSADGHGGAPEVAAAGGHAFTRPAAVFTCVFRVLRHQPPPLQQRPAMAKHSNGHTRKIMANTEGAEVGSIDDPSGTDLRPTQQLSQTGRHRAAPARNGQVRRAHSVPVGLVGQQLVGRPPDQVPVEKRHTPC